MYKWQISSGNNAYLSSEFQTQIQWLSSDPGVLEAQHHLFLTIPAFDRVLVQQHHKVGTERRPRAASCTSLHSEWGLQGSITALGIPEDFKSNYKTINQCSQDFGGHKKQVREDMCLRSSWVTPSSAAARATSSLSSPGPDCVPWVGGCPPEPPRSKR